MLLFLCYYDFIFSYYDSRISKDLSDLLDSLFSRGNILRAFFNIPADHEEGFCLDGA